MSDNDRGSSEPAHAPGTRRAEEMISNDGKEAGRTARDASHAGRPAGERNVRDSTSINEDAVEGVTGNSKMPPA